MTTQTRVVAGVPTGGQYAAGARAEPDVSLVPSFDGAPELDGQELIDAAMTAARRKAYQHGLPATMVEAIAQSTITTALKTRRNTPSTVLTVRYIERVTHNHASLTARGAATPQNYKARGLLRTKVAETEQELGRHLSPVERDRLAGEIRDGWHDQRHRPSQDFARSVRPVQVDIDTLGREEEPEVAPMEFYDDAATAAVSQLAQVSDGRAAARKHVWDTLAAFNDTPPVAHGSITGDRATAHRRALTSRGGVLAAVSVWESGEDDEATSALFAPFAGIDEHGKDQVCLLLRRHPHLAADLHAAAMTSATRERRRRP